MAAEGRVACTIRFWVASVVWARAGGPRKHVKARAVDSRAAPIGVKAPASKKTERGEGGRAARERALRASPGSAPAPRPLLMLPVRAVTVRRILAKTAVAKDLGRSNINLKSKRLNSSAYVRPRAKRRRSGLAAPAPVVGAFFQPLGKRHVGRIGVLKSHAHPFAFAI